MKRTVLAIVCTSVLTALIMGQGKDDAVPKVIQAERFELVDAAGEVQAFLGITSDGGVWLELGGSRGGKVILHTTVGGDASIIAGSGERTGTASLHAKSKGFAAQMTATAKFAGVEAKDNQEDTVVAMMATKNGAVIEIDGADSERKTVASAD